ncbi:MAG: hypothetical protein LBP33_07825 [Candidatus Adiutrix sp.]|jgi:uncharacterized protein YfaS (alpha-2-macroglobulin family)|nr:hypothetical protein [Candidatus Adiutrix sp.]
MKKNSFRLVRFFLLALAICLNPACQEEKKPEAAAVSRPAPAESADQAAGRQAEVGSPEARAQGAPGPEGQALSLLRFGPSGELKKLNQVAAMFNQPMAALGDYRNVPEGALSLDPPMEGQALWLNQYTLAYVFKEPLTGSLELTARLKPENLKALSGARLDQGAEIKVKLPLLAPLSRYQSNVSPRDIDEALTPVWRVLFNQNPDLESLGKKAFFKWSDSGGEQKIPARVETVPGHDPNFLTFTARGKLPPDRPYQLTVEEGAASLAGPLPAPPLTLAEGRTYGPLRVTVGSVDEEKVDPDRGLYLHFTNRVKISELVRLIKIDNDYDLTPLVRQFNPEKEEPPAGADPAAEETGDEVIDDFRDYLYLPGGLKADTDYRLTIDGSARDIFGQTLGGDFVHKFHTGEYETFLRLRDGYGLLETGSEAKVRLWAGNIREARVEAYSLTAEQAIGFLAEADFSPDYFGDLSTAEKTLANLKPEVLTLAVPDGARHGRTPLTLDLKKIYGDDLSGRLLYLRSAWTVPARENAKEYQDHTYALIQVSDIGLAVKMGPESSLIWTSHLGRGQSWAGVALDLRDQSGRLLWSGQSDAQGLAELPGALEILREAGPDRPNLFVVARAEGQMSLWNVNWNDGLETWRWDLNTGDPLGRDEDQSSWLLNSLPLYKPGETAKFKIIARQRQGDQLRDLAGQDLEVEIRDGADELVERRLLKTGPLGTLSHELPIPRNAALGYWSVRAGRPGQTDLPELGSFMVMTYRPPAFEIKMTDPPQNPLAGQTVEIRAEAGYHYGAPVAGQPVRYSVSASPAEFSLPGDFSQYSVINRFEAADEDRDDGYDRSEPSVTVASDEVRLDAGGLLKFRLNLSPTPEQRPRPRNYQSFVTVTDVDQRTVSTSASFLVHPAEIYAGLYRDQYVTEAGRPYRLKLIAADREGRLISGRPVSLTLHRRVWQNVRRKSPGSAYEYVSRMLDEKIETRTVSSADLPAEVEFTPEKPGHYWVLAELQDEQGRVNQASCDFYVSGSGPVGWFMGNDDRLTLVADRDSYQAGDQARIMVQSPFDRGQGLLTVERAGVRSSRVFEITSQTPVLEIPVTDDDSPNIFVSVLLVRGRIADKLDEAGLDFGKPAIRLGYTELKVPSRKDLFTVRVTPDQKEVGPGGEVEVDLEVVDYYGQPATGAEVALIVADAAVLQLGGEAAYHPETLYHRDRPLMVQTADNLVSLIGRQNWGSKGDNPGGGGGLMEAAALMKDRSDDGIRRLFAALAHFEPRVALDQSGRARVKVKMPENLTTFKIFAVATGPGRKTGTGQNSVLVSRDLLVRSALPGYAGVGDEFQAAVVLSNRGRISGEAAVRLEGDNFSLVNDSAAKTVTLGPDQSQELHFKVKAGSAGEARFLFSVTLGPDRDSVEYVLPVSPPNPLSTQASYERLLPGQATASLALAEGLDPGRGGLELALSPSLAGVLTEPFDWLAAYPHGCVEQSVSKAYASLVWLRLKERLNGTAEKEEQARRDVQSQLARLLRWEQGGGYNFWPETYDWSSRSVYLSAYVLDFLLSARDDGFELPDPALPGRIADFLKEALGGESRSFPAWYSPEAVREAKSYALAMLGRSGENVAAYIELLYQDREKLGLFELANLIRAVAFLPQGQNRDLRLAALIPLLDRHLQVSAGEAQFVEPAEGAPEIWSSSVRTSALALSVLCQTAPRHDLLPALVRWLVSASRGGHFGTTQNNALALAALSDYVKTAEPENPDLDVKALLGESLLAQARFKSFSDRPALGQAPLSAIPAESPSVSYEVQGQGQAWAALKIRTAPLAPDLSAASSGGFRLARSFEVVSPEAGPAGALRFKRGDVVRVSVTMMVPAPRHNVVLMDRVPAGLEPVNFNLAEADLSLLNLPAGENEDERRLHWYRHQEIWPDRVAVYADRLEAGVYSYSYLARAVTSGVYLTPGPQAEEMYAPETFGRGTGQSLEVAD